ncbi:hypothetical protein pb186bvf_003186 [Paramecium bursaria]
MALLKDAFNAHQSGFLTVSFAEVQDFQLAIWVFNIACSCDEGRILIHSIMQYIISTFYTLNFSSINIEI